MSLCSLWNLSIRNRQASTRPCSFQNQVPYVISTGPVWRKRPTSNVLFFDDASAETAGAATVAAAPSAAAPLSTVLREIGDVIAESLFFVCSDTIVLLETCQL